MNENIAPTILYSSLTPVESGLHGNLRLLTEVDYLFARETNSLPVNWDEFVLAARCYPIVFSQGEKPIPVLIVGLGGSKNLFVDDKGVWKTAFYIPQYVRRYPFILIKHEERLVLCLDQAARSFSEIAGEPLFVDGAMSPTLSEKLQFCGEYEKRSEMTLSFTQALREHGLLIERSAEVTLNSGRTAQISGFSIIDEEKFARLNDDVFLQWRGRGWLNLVYLHLASMGSWSNVIELASESEATEYQSYAEKHLTNSNVDAVANAGGAEDEPVVWIRP